MCKSRRLELIPLGTSGEQSRAHPQSWIFIHISHRILVNQCHQHEPFFSSSFSVILLIHPLIKANGFLPLYTDSASHFRFSSRIQTHKPLGQSSVNPLCWEPCLQSQPGAILAMHYGSNTSDRMLFFLLLKWYNTAYYVKAKRSHLIFPFCPTLTPDNQTYLMPFVGSAPSGWALALSLHSIPFSLYFLPVSHICLL